MSIQRCILSPLTSKLRSDLRVVIPVGILDIILVDIGIVAVVIAQDDEIPVRIVDGQPRLEPVIGIGTRQEDGEARIVGTHLGIEIALLDESERLKNKANTRKLNKIQRKNKPTPLKKY